MGSWLSWLSLLVSALALLAASRAAWLASTTRTFRGLSRALRELDEHVAVLDVHAEAIRKLQLADHARTMTANRQRKKDQGDPAEEPDWQENPDAWKRWASRNLGVFKQ